MINFKKTQRILRLEHGGFFVLLALSWLNELCSLPHWTYDNLVHLNWAKMILDTAAIATTWMIVIFSTRRLIKRMIYLEGFLRICAWCQKVNVGDADWSSVEELFGSKLNFKTSHAMCPKCKQKWKINTQDTTNNHTP